MRNRKDFLSFKSICKMRRTSLSLLLIYICLGFFDNGKLRRKIRHIQASLGRSLLQIFFVLHFIIFNFLSYIFKSLTIFHLKTKQTPPNPKHNKSTKKPPTTTNPTWLSPSEKGFFKSSVPLVLIRLYIYKDVFTPTYDYQY